MAIRGDDPLTFLRALGEDPAAVAELRRLVASDELRELAGEVRALVRAQRDMANGLEQLAQRLDALAQAQLRTEQRLDALAEAQRQTEDRIGRLVDAVAELTSNLRALSIRSDRDHGTLVEFKYERHGSAYFAPIALRLRLLTADQRDDMLDAAVSAGALNEDEANDIRIADLLFRGRLRSDGSEVILVVEASGMLERDDVERAHLRAQLLSRAGVVALPVVAGDSIGARALDSARRGGVWTVLDGRAEAPDAA